MEVSPEQASWPDDFRCPISLEAMTDPVILPSGHIFKRRSIQRWLDGGRLTYPVTNLPLPPSPPFIPNHSLCRLVAAVSPAVAAAAGEKVRGGEYQEVETMLSSVLGMLRLVKSRAAERREVLEFGAMAVLLRHAATGDDARMGLVADGAVDALSVALSGGDTATGHAATTLMSLATVTVGVNKCTIGAHPSTIPALARLLRRGGALEQHEAATILYELCKLPENRRRTVRAGAVPALAELAVVGSACVVEVLGLIAKSREGRQELSKIPGILSVLCSVAGSGNARAIEVVVLN